MLLSGHGTARSLAAGARSTAGQGEISGERRADPCAATEAWLHCFADDGLSLPDPTRRLLLVRALRAANIF